MQVETLPSTLLLPGQQLSSSHLAFNPQNIFQISTSSMYALKIGQVTQKLVKNSNQQTINYLDMLTFPSVYEPEKGNLVIGVIKTKSADYYTVDIGSPLDSVLWALQFDGATKKNKPNIAQGSLVFCRVTEHSKYLGSKLSCINKGYNSQNELGELKGGMRIEAPRYKQKLIEQRLEKIAKHIKFEIAFGHNGYVWIKAGTLSTTIILYNVIRQILTGCDNQLVSQILETAQS